MKTFKVTRKIRFGQIDAAGIAFYPRLVEMLNDTVEDFFDQAIEGLSSFTEFKSLKIEKSLSYNWVSLVELKPKTGRTHQLRIHLAKAGFPIIGDYVHDTENVLKGKGLFLAACEIEFIHPQTNEKNSFKCAGSF